jgi:hypothetical protein
MGHLAQIRYENRAQTVVAGEIWQLRYNHFPIGNCGRLAEGLKALLSGIIPANNKWDDLLPVGL